jgi:hypothetical protein
MLSIIANETFAQKPNSNTHGSGDTVAQLAHDVSKMQEEQGIAKELLVTYEETPNSVELEVRRPYVLGQKWLPKATVGALRTYYLLNEIQEQQISKGKMAYLRPLIKRVLAQLETDWMRRNSDSRAARNLKTAYQSTLRLIYSRVERHARNSRKAFIEGESLPPNPSGNTPETVEIVFDTNPSGGLIWTVLETEFRLARRAGVAPPWRERGGTSRLEPGDHRYRIKWPDGRSAVADAPFEIFASGKLLLPGAIFTPKNK